MKKSMEMLQELESMKVETRNLLDADKIEEAKAKQEEMRNLKTKIEIQKELEMEEEREIEIKTETREEVRTMEKQAINEVRAFENILRGKATEEERALVTTTGADGGYLVPKDVNTVINEKKRQYKSAKALVGLYPTSTQAGSMVYEDTSAITELVNLTEGEDIAEAAPKFLTAPYAVKDYAGVVPVSNILLQDEKSDLTGYIGEFFAKKAIRTENAKIFAALKTGKTAKAISGFKALKTMINKDLDPSIAMNSVVVMNQDAFAFLDEELDSSGRPVLQPNPVNPTERLFMGLPVHVFSNVELPTVATKAPIIVGSLTDAIKFVDRGVYEVKPSSEAGFMKNLTYIRCIERFDVVKTDADAYVIGEITIA